jgi:hypothetical protein
MSTNGNGNGRSFFTNVTKDGSQAAYGKFGFEGPPGSGKTTTAALLAVGISKEYHNGAPVVWVDSENGANFIRPIFVAEKADLLVVPTRSLSTLIEAVSEARKAGACVLVPDSMTKFWTTLVSNYMKEHSIKNYKQMLSHWPAVKDPWREWSDLFINCPLHTIACGRGGFEYDQVDVIDDEGNVNTETVKGDYKMKGEGEFGHEPDVNLHFQAMTDPNAPRNVKTQTKKKVGSGENQRTVRGKIELVAPRKIHVATVQKGRVWQLNGKAFSWADRDSYKPGEYKEVLDCFRPYMEALNIGGKHQAVAAGVNPFHCETNGSYLKKKKLIETWDATMQIVFPGSTAINQQRRRFVGEKITGTLSKTAFAGQHVEAVQFQVLHLNKLRERLKTEGIPEGDKDFGALIDLAFEEATADWRSLNLQQIPTEEPVAAGAVAEPF